jgi:hypothetical protein
MTLDNQLRIGQLKRHRTDRAEIGYLLAAARRNLCDARAENISIENRFDASDTRRPAASSRRSTRRGTPAVCASI